MAFGWYAVAGFDAVLGGAELEQAGPASTGRAEIVKADGQGQELQSNVGLRV